MTRHLLSLTGLTREELAAVLDLAEEESPPAALSGQGVALLFEHPSARTRSATEMAVVQLGGHPVTIRGDEVGIDRRETAEDVARTLACYHAVIAARVERHSTLERMARALDDAGMAVPVVNLLSDREHPTQAIADLLTMRHHLGSLEGRTLAYVGDANNVCRSLVAACALSGMVLRVASPRGYELSEDDPASAGALGGTVEQMEDPAEAVASADAIYTDVWVSMGDEGEASARRQALAGYGIDEELLSHARKDAIVMHCLPAHRGEEISAAVLEGPRSVVWEQARERTNAARAVLRFVLGYSGAAGEPQ